MTPDETITTQYDVKLPPNARMKTIAFDHAAKTLRITLADGDAERIVGVADVRALHGARIRRESVTQLPPKGAGPALSSVALTATTGLPVGLLSSVGRKSTTVREETLHYALAMRVDRVGELWYLLADSFNFRKTLGPDAAYVTEFNVRELVKRLAAFTPQAVQDAFFAAIVGSLPLPPPVESLVEFFRIVAR